MESCAREPMLWKSRNRETKHLSTNAAPPPPSPPPPPRGFWAFPPPIIAKTKGKTFFLANFFFFKNFWIFEERKLFFSDFSDFFRLFFQIFEETKRIILLLKPNVFQKFWGEKKFFFFLFQIFGFFLCDNFDMFWIFGGIYVFFGFFKNIF